MIGRRGFITGLISLVAAPAIVRAGSLMPVKMMPDETALAKAMQAYIENVVNPPLLAAMQDMTGYGTGALEFTAGEVRHVPFKAMPILRDHLPGEFLSLPGLSGWR